MVKLSGVSAAFSKKRSVSQRLTSLFGVLSLGLVFGLSIQFARAWTNPTATPPGGNVAGPLNTGGATQTKGGILGITGTLVVNGWDATISTSDTSGRLAQVIGTYQGWDANAIYLGGYNSTNNAAYASNKVIVGGSGSALPLYVTGGLSVASGGAWNHGGVTIGGQTLNSEGPWLYVGDTASPIGVYGTYTFANGTTTQMGLAAGNLWAQNNICLAGDCRSAWPGGADNLGNHIATQDLVMSSKNITGASGVYSTIFQSQDNGRGTLTVTTEKGSLPGYPSDYYPTIGSSKPTVYFSGIDDSGTARYNAAISTAGIYSRIFRDLDDGNNYYVDPNGSSVVDTIYANWFRANAGTGLYFQPNAGNTIGGGGWYMIDNTWIRSYNAKYVYMQKGFDTEDTGTSGVGCNGGKGYLNTTYTFTFQACGSVGLDIIYDRNNPAYYVNPNDTTVLNVVQANTFFYPSDETLKKDITILPNALENLNSIRGVSFRWKKDDALSIGVIAQEVEKVYPELVHTDDKGLKAVQYGNLIGPIIEAIKEVNSKVEKLLTSDNEQTKELEAQRRVIEELKTEIRALREAR